MQLSEFGTAYAISWKPALLNTGDCEGVGGTLATASFVKYIRCPRSSIHMLYGT